MIFKNSWKIERAVFSDLPRGPGHLPLTLMSDTLLYDWLCDSRRFVTRKSKFEKHARSNPVHNCLRFSFGVLPEPNRPSTNEASFQPALENRKSKVGHRKGACSRLFTLIHDRSRYFYGGGGAQPMETCN